MVIANLYSCRGGWTMALAALVLLAPGALIAAWEQEGRRWSPRRGHETVSFQDRLWVLGGAAKGDAGTQLKNDIWSSSDGINWSLETPDAAWSKRSGHAIVAFDPDGSGKRLWALGGATGHTTTAPRLNDVWSSTDGIHWTLETSDAGWPVRDSHQAVVFDADGNGERIWVFGGYNSEKAFQDVWSSADGVNWTQHPDAPWPARSFFAGAVFDPDGTGERIWIFGGYGNDPSNWQGVLNDVWSTADGVNWTNERPGGADWTARIGHTVIAGDIGGSGRRLWLTGGSAGTTLWNDVWSSTDGANWVEEFSFAPWAGRTDHSAVTFDPDGNGDRLWVLGGDLAPWNGGFTGDVWSSADGLSWRSEGLSRHHHVTVSFQNQMWMLGGLTAQLSLNDILASADGATWTRVTDAAPWSARWGHAGVVFQDRLWVLGGFDGTNRNDVWWTDDGIQWTQAPDAPWIARSQHSAVVFNNRLWVLGGLGVGFHNDVWWTEDGVNWTQAPSAPWSGRYGHLARAYDGRIWLMGGTDGDYRNDVWWTEDGAIWTQAPDAPWTGRFNHSGAVYNHRLWVLSGGQEPAPLNDAWAFTTEGGWELISTDAPWAGRFNHAATVFDGRLWITGGQVNGIDLTDSVWHLTEASQPWILTTPPSTAAVEVPYIYPLVVAGGPTPDVTVTGLPPWLTWDAGLISGTPGVSDIGTTGLIVITATNSEGVATQEFQIEVEGVAPDITSAPLTSVTAGTAYSYVVVAQGAPAPTLDAFGVPGWLTFDPFTGELFGTAPSSSVGATGEIVITADNGWGEPATQAFTITIESPFGSPSGGHGGGCALAPGSGQGALWLLGLLALLGAGVYSRRRCEPRLLNAGQNSF